MRKILHCLAVICILSLAVGGCWEKEKTAVDRFKETQEKTITPHGRIKKDSVKAVDGNRIQYETDQGHVFRVKAEKEKDGYRYSAPEQIKRKGADGID